MKFPMAARIFLKYKFAANITGFNNKVVLSDDFNWQRGIKL